MAKIKLTDKNIHTLPGRPGKETSYGDEQFPGLYLRITRKNVRSYVLRYTNTSNGRQEKHTLGRIDFMSVADARKQAADFLAQIHAGEDPKETKPKKVTVSDLAKTYWAEKERELKNGELKPETLTLYRGAYRKYIGPMLGSKLVSDIKLRDITAVTEDLKSTTKNRVLSILKQMFELALLHEWIEHLPTIGAKRGRPGRNARYLSVEEIQKVGRAMDEIRKEREATQQSTAAVDCLAALFYTGCRKMEMMALRWDQIDWETATITLTDFKGVTQTSHKTKEIYLSDGLSKILKRRSRNRINEYVFPAVDGRGRPITHVKNLFNPWKAILKRAGVGDARIHDIRHSVASIALATDVPMHLVSGILGHKNRSTTERYAHLQNEPVRKAVEGVGATVAAALGTSALNNTR